MNRGDFTIVKKKLGKGHYVPVLALLLGGIAPAQAQFSANFRDPEHFAPFRFDLPGNIPKVTGDLGDLGYYDVRDGVMLLTAQQDCTLAGSANNARLTPNVRVKDATPPADWFIETKFKVNFLGFKEAATVGLLIADDADNYCLVHLKHNVRNFDYLNVAFEQNGVFTPEMMDDTGAYFGVNLDYVTVKIEKIADADEIRCSVTKPDGITLYLPSITPESNLSLYQFLLNPSGKRIGLSVESGGHAGMRPVAIQTFRTNLAVETPAKNKPIFREEFKASDTDLDFTVPGSLTPDSLDPYSYFMGNNAFTTLLNGGISATLDNPKNIPSLIVSTTAPIPENWFIKLRVNTNFDGQAANPWAGITVLDDVNNWVGLGRKHTAYGGGSLDYGSLTTELDGRNSEDVAAYSFPAIEPKTGYMTLTMQRDPLTGQIALTYQGSNGDGTQFGYIRDGDTRFGGTPRGQHYQFVYNFLRNMNGKRIALYGDNQGAPGLYASYDYLMTNLPIEVPIKSTPISGTLDFGGVDKKAIPPQKVTFRFRAIPDAGKNRPGPGLLPKLARPVRGTKKGKKNASRTSATATNSVFTASVPDIVRVAYVPPTGEFRFESIPAGNYSLLIKPERFLQIVRPADNRNGEVTGITGTMFLGDINGDNRIDLVDLSLLQGVFNSLEGDDDYAKLINADLNQDGGIDFGDMAAMLQNYNRIGED